MDELSPKQRRWLVIISCVSGFTLSYVYGNRGWNYLLGAIVVAIVTGIALFFLGLFAVFFLSLFKESLVKKNIAIRYTFILAMVFLALEIWKGQTITASFSPHHYYQGRDMLVRTATMSDDQGNPYQVPVAWYNPSHELHVYYINDAHPTTWYKDLNGQWHQAHDWDSSNVHFVMWAIEIAILVLVYRKAKEKENKLLESEMRTENA